MILLQISYLIANIVKLQPPDWTQSENEDAKSFLNTLEPNANNGSSIVDQSLIDQFSRLFNILFYLAIIIAVFGFMMVGFLMVNGIFSSDPDSAVKHFRRSIGIIFGLAIIMAAPNIISTVFG